MHGYSFVVLMMRHCRLLSAHCLLLSRGANAVDVIDDRLLLSLAREPLEEGLDSSQERVQ